MDDGHIMTEKSIGVNIGGNEILIPSIVPTLTPEEINYLKSGGEMNSSIVKKASEHAMERLRQGLSPFID